MQYELSPKTYELQQYVLKRHRRLKPDRHEFYLLLEIFMKIVYTIIYFDIKLKYENWMGFHN